MTIDETGAVTAGSRGSDRASGLRLDEIFFSEHGDRRYRIRFPVGREYEEEFRSLGAHEKGRRRVIVMRMGGFRGRVLKARTGSKCMGIPFLAFADEEISDEDGILAPIFDGIMAAARGV